MFALIGLIINKSVILIHIILDENVIMCYLSMTIAGVLIHLYLVVFAIFKEVEMKKRMPPTMGGIRFASFISHTCL